MLAMKADFSQMLKIFLVESLLNYHFSHELECRLVFSDRDKSKS
jgi:hypothetical protein